MILIMILILIQLNFYFKIHQEIKILNQKKNYKLTNITSRFALAHSKEFDKTEVLFL